MALQAIGLLERCGWKPREERTGGRGALDNSADEHEAPTNWVPCQFAGGYVLLLDGLLGDV